MVQSLVSSGYFKDALDKTGAPAWVWLMFVATGGLSYLFHSHDHT